MSFCELAFFSICSGRAMLDLVALVPVAETLAESVEEVVAALAPTTGVAPSVSALSVLEGA